jgi:hypothetical protein
MKKLYFKDEDSEHCYPEDHFQDVMRFSRLTKIKVFEAVKSKDKNFIYCKEAQTCGEASECGKDCEDYTPKNGKNGCCKNRGTMYDFGSEVELFLKT